MSDTEQVSEEETYVPPPSEEAKQRRLKLQKLSVYHQVMVITSLVIWVGLFSAGLLVETMEYRLVLAPISVRSQLGEDFLKHLDEYYKLVEENAVVPKAKEPVTKETPKEGEKKAEQKEANDPNLKGKVSTTAVSAVEPPATPPATPKFAYYGSLEKHLEKQKKHLLYSVFITILCFTPINLAIITFFSGLIGGYAANIRLATMTDEIWKTMEPRSRWCLEEPPMTAAIRGFVVYLCVIAGLYIAMDDPFKSPTPGQYIRLAGLLSSLGFLVGYDSSRLEDWLTLIPNPGGGANAKKETKTITN